MKFKQCLVMEESVLLRLLHGAPVITVSEDYYDLLSFNCMHEVNINSPLQVEKRSLVYDLIQVKLSVITVWNIFISRTFVHGA